MPEYTLEDGTILEGVPEGVSKEEAQRVFNSFQRPFSETSSPNYSGPQSFMQGAAARFTNNIANVPDLAANLGARAFTRVSNPSQRNLSGEQPFSNPLNPPAFGQDYVPGPTGPDLQGAVQRVGEGAAAIATGDFNQFSPNPAQDQRELNERMRQENPAAYFMGGVSGDILTLVTGRAPIAKSRGLANLGNQQKVKMLNKAEKADISLAPTVSEVLDLSTRRSSSFRTLLNRAGRAGEAGAEGFVLAALNGEADPVETMGFAAGMQGAGSLALSGMGDLVSGGFTKAGLKIGIASFAIGSLIQLANSSLRDGNDFVLDSMENGYSKVLLGLAAGAVSGLSGYGRVTKNFPTSAGPKIADMITSMPRAVVNSLFTEAMEDPATMSVVKKLAINPNYFSPEATRRLERGYLNGNFRNELESLMLNDDFRRQFEAISQ